MTSQMVTVIITRDDRHDGFSRWTAARLDLDSLIRRMGFELIAQMAGSLNDGPSAYQVTGTREGPLGDDGIEAIRRELGNLVYLYSIPALSVGFGSIDQHLDL